MIDWLQRYEEKIRITIKKSEKNKKLSVNFRLVPKNYPNFSQRKSYG